MARPRSKIVSLSTTPYYHCITRCVRRAFLCGEDRYSGQNFDHRKPWFIQRLKLLTEAFAIDIAAFSLMSNHYHLVLHVDQARSQAWTKNMVIDRWLTLYKGPDLIHRYLRHELSSDVELKMVNDLVEVWRERLFSLSWYMRCLNEYVARKANKEDNCKGRFWESRFVSQGLLDETALLSCMAYVDLNPIRAGVSQDLENSEFTSIRERINQVKGTQKTTTPRLMSFREGSQVKLNAAVIPFNLKDYIELVDWTGRLVRKDKRGFIEENKPALLSSLKLSDRQWQYLALEIQKRSISLLHGLEKLGMKVKSKNKQAGF